MKAPQKLSEVEFIALMAMVMATIAFAIDAMLPALPEIGEALSPDDLNRAQLMITSFIFGMGVGTFVTGPLSDAYGRKIVMLWGAAIYIAAALLAWIAESLTLMLVARVLMGLGAAGPRVVAVAMIRDLYSGREMAKIMSFVLLVFSLIPGLAPTLGYFVMLAFGWRAIFLTFALFAIVVSIWLWLRQPETLPPAQQRPLNAADMWSATKEIFAHRTATLSIFIQTLTLGALFTTIAATQQTFDVTFGQGENFHLWFGGIALVAATSSLLNARIVMVLGMRAIIKTMYVVQIVCTIVMIAITLTDPSYTVAFGAYILWVTSNFFVAGLTLGNLNALAMEEMGHIAGLAASVIAAVSTIGAALLAAPVGMLFDGTPMPAALGILAMAAGALWLILLVRRPSDLQGASGEST